MRMTYKEFEDRKKKYFSKHDFNFTTHTSPMDENGVYHKEYVFADGFIWYERYEKIVRTIITDTEYNCKVKVDIELFETESWNSEDAKSVYLYEQF